MRYVPFRKIFRKILQGLAEEEGFEESTWWQQETVCDQKRQHFLLKWLPFQEVEIVRGIPGRGQCRPYEVQSTQDE